MTRLNAPEAAALFLKKPTEDLLLSPAEHREGRLHAKTTATIAEEMANALNKAVLAEDTGSPIRAG